MDERAGEKETAEVEIVCVLAHVHVCMSASAHISAGSKGATWGGEPICDVCSPRSRLL